MMQWIMEGVPASIIIILKWAICIMSRYQEVRYFTEKNTMPSMIHELNKLYGKHTIDYLLKEKIKDSLNCPGRDQFLFGHFIASF